MLEYRRLQAALTLLVLAWPGLIRGADDSGAPTTRAAFPHAVEVPDALGVSSPLGVPPLLANVPDAVEPETRVNVPLDASQPDDDPAAVTPPGRAGEALGEVPASPARGLESSLRESLGRSLPTIALFALASLVPAAVLMMTAFVRISIVLTLLRQAIGSPQVPGNQVLSALALMLTALVMWPVGETVATRGLVPYAEGRLGPIEAWEAGTAPIKDFMIDQMIRTGHQGYLIDLYVYAFPSAPGEPPPDELDRAAVPLRVVAPAFLLSELTTALVMGFAIYLPFLVVDLVVSAVLAAMGLFLLPPTLVAMPLKLILFVLAGGWKLVADALLHSFQVSS